MCAYSSARAFTAAATARAIPFRPCRASSLRSARRCFFMFAPSPQSQFLTRSIACRIQFAPCCLSSCLNASSSHNAAFLLPPTIVQSAALSASSTLASAASALALHHNAPAALDTFDIAVEFVEPDEQASLGNDGGSFDGQPSPKTPKTNPFSNASGRPVALDSDSDEEGEAERYLRQHARLFPRTVPISGPAALGAGHASTGAFGCKSLFQCKL
jgi:hypothetical protein